MEWERLLASFILVSPTWRCEAPRWITSSASLGTVSVAGYSLQDLQAAQLSINRAYDAVSGRLIDAAQHASNAAHAVIDWSGNAQTLTLSASKSLVLAQALPRFEIPVSGSIDIGGAFVTGQFKITLEQSGADRIWTVDAQGASVGLRSGGAYVGIENASGTLTLLLLADVLSGVEAAAAGRGAGPGARLFAA